MKTDVIKKYMKNTLVIVFLLSTLFIISPVKAQEVPLYGGTISIHIPTQPPALSSMTGSSWIEYVIACQIFNSLVDIGPDKKTIVPSLADNWEINSLEKSYTFHLRKDVMWHDGIPFTSADVKFSFEEIHSKFHPESKQFFKGTTVDTPDDYTAIIKPKDWLPSIHFNFFIRMATGIFPKHILEGQDLFTTKFNNRPIGTGPFMFKDMKIGSHIILEKNPNYWKKDEWGNKLPYLDKVIFRVIPEVATALGAYRKGEIDHIFRGISFEQAMAMKKLPNTTVSTSYDPPYKLMTCFNLNKKDRPISANKLARKGLFYAIDRLEIIERATSGNARYSDSIWNSDLYPLSPNITKYPPRGDKAMAERLLDEAGYSKQADGKRFSIEILLRRGQVEEIAVGELMRDMWAEVGVDCTLNILDYASWKDVIWKKRDFDVFIYASWHSPHYKYRFYHSDYTERNLWWNMFPLNNSEVDTGLDMWRSESDKAKQDRGLEIVDEVLTDLLPVYCLYDMAWANVLRGDFKFSPASISVMGNYAWWGSVEDTYWTKGTPPSP